MLKILQPFVCIRQTTPDQLCRISLNGDTTNCNSCEFYLVSMAARFNICEFMEMQLSICRFSFFSFSIAPKSTTIIFLSSSWISKYSQTFPSCRDCGILVPASDQWYLLDKQNKQCFTKGTCNLRKYIFYVDFTQNRPKKSAQTRCQSDR